MLKSQRIITGKLRFSPRKILLEHGEDTYFVRPFSVKSGYIHGDYVKARITRKNSSDKLSEVEVMSLVERSGEVLLATVFLKKEKAYLGVKKEQGVFQVSLPLTLERYVSGDILAIQFSKNGMVKILEKFAHISDYDLEERMILFFGNVRTTFPKAVSKERTTLQHKKKLTYSATQKRSYNSEFFKEFYLEKLIKNDTYKSDEKIIDFQDNRVDFRNWYTLTIDGADAKDLDDAISIARYEDGGFLLGVHIADVAEYVKEHSELDKEALLRATSIYTPGRVIPMLPEVFSNDLCSLHPGTAKYTLTCLMKVDLEGYVERTEIVEGIIESQKKGVYEEIYKSMKAEGGRMKSGEKLESENPPTKGGSSAISVQSRGVLFEGSQDDYISEIHKQTPLDLPLTGGYEDQPFHTTISTVFDLYSILFKRRKREGKIMFESTEIQFSVDTGKINISKRDRNDAHMLIEEFMVLANEEVAKWCVRHELPFLSRVHGLPSSENINLIANIIENIEARKKLEPRHIRSYMEKIADPVEQFRLSRLLLPKMAKATYTDLPFRHFGLALSYYSHFTSPIRRYPDLQIHRIIKEEIRGTMTPERKTHYRNILKKVARLSSERERAAESIERAFDSLYACRYMQDKVGKVYTGRIAGITEHALYVELENGIEGTLFLPRKKFFVNPVTGSLENIQRKELYRIGQTLTVVIDMVNMEEKRILLREMDKKS